MMMMRDSCETKNKHTIKHLYELLQSRNTGKNSVNQYKSILYCSYNVFRSSLDHHQVLIHVHHATIILANVLHATCLLMQVFIK
jgi:hypothetical protein